MNILGITLTWGHFIVGLVMVGLYDLGMDLLVADDFSTKWFQRKNVPLRAIGYGVIITLAVLAQVNPVLTAWLVLGLALSVGGYFWWRHNNP